MTGKTRFAAGILASSSIAKSLETLLSCDLKKNLNEA